MKRTTINYLIYIMILLAVGGPMLFPMGLPLQVSKEAKGVYDAIQSLPEKSVIVLDVTFEPGNEAELWPCTVALMQHAFSRPLKIVVVTLTHGGGIVYALRALDMIDKHGKQYGVDYVYLGYFAGLEAALSTMVADVHRLAKTDYFGTPIDQIPMMKNINTGKDFNFYVVIAAGLYPSYLGLIQAPYKVPMVMAVVSVSSPEVTSYYRAGQLVGFLNGVRGAAEYEKLINRPYWGLGLMDSVSISHMLLVAFVVVGNIAFLAGKIKRRN